MERTLTVKGTGRVRLKPDTIIITMTLKSTDKKYDKAVEESASVLGSLKGLLEDVGFEENDIKTVNFSVYTEHNSVQDGSGNYRPVFKGYSCAHEIKLEFDFNSEMLSKTINVISHCIANPELSIRFTVKDKTAAEDELLKNAAENAKRRAETLAAASGVKLGKLISVDFNKGDYDFYSETGYSLEEKCMAKCGSGAINIEPEDISLADSAVFVWELSDKK